MGDPILGSSEELLEKQGDTRPDPDKKISATGDTKPDPDREKLRSADFESRIDSNGDVPG